MDFLTKRTIFQCMASSAVIFTISASGKVTHKNSTVLTTSAKLSGKGICPILTAAAQGVPQPCKFQQTAWLAFDFTRKANGENLLTENSFCMCPIGSTVKVFTTNAFGYHDGFFSAPTAAQVAALQNLKVDSPKNPAAPKTSSPPPTSDIPKNISKNNSDDTSKNSSQKISENKSASTQEIEQPATKSTKNLKYVLQCSDCERKNTCKYSLDKFGKFAVVINREQNKKPSQELRDNYEDVHGKTYRKIFDDCNCGNQAHHLVSVGVFKNCTKLAKFANACGYDINCAENCIILPTKREGHGQLDQLGKSASAFDVMSLTGMQWHLGGHSYGEYDEKHKYSFPKEELKEIERQVKMRTGKNGKVRPYAELVKAELNKIKIPDKGSTICPAKIIKRLNNISNKIRKKLEAFKENPAASHPFYVSREAYHFAFKVPRLKKFIVVRRDGKNFILERYKTVGKGNDIVLQESLTTNQPREVVKFCGNIQHFIFVAGVDLPFPAEFSRNVENFNADNVAEIIVWLRENPVENYVAPARKISERLEKLK